MDILNLDIKSFLPQIISTGITLLFLSVFRYLAVKFVLKITQAKDRLSKRSNLIVKYVNFVWSFLLIISFTAIWGLNPKEISSFLISITAFVGVAFFAQWSVLSNITGGVVLFFSYPFKIGDVVKIQDKDFPLTARIEDITAFYIILTTTDGDTITYPNNMMLQKAIIIVDDLEIINSIPNKN